MTDIASLEVELDLDNGRFLTNINKSGQAVQKFGKTVDGQGASLQKMERQIGSVSVAVDRLNKMIGGFVGFKALSAGFMDLVNTQKAMQQIHYGLLGALGNNRAAGDAYDYIAAKSQELGLDLQVTAIEFTKVAAAATAMGVPMQRQQELFDGLARSATVLHLSTDQVKYATMALSQMFGKGKIQAEELRRQLGEQIPGVVPRFQNAVMQMVKGTDLAGKSFDQLLQAGALTTDKFLPALVQALQETGRGADAASQSLNANLNRLSSEWFKLKAEMTSGLFNDALSASVGALAANLQNLANAAMLAMTVIGSRYASKGVTRGNQEYITGPKMAAASEIAYAKAQVDTAKASLDSAKAETLRLETRIRANQETIKSVAVEKSEALQLKQIATAARIAAEQELALVTARTGKNAPKAFQRRAEQARAVEAAATTALTNAELKLTTVTQIGGAAAVGNASARGRLATAKGVETVATNALTAAEERLNLVTNKLSVGRRLADMAKSLGSSLLSLVGGIQGAVIGAVAIIGYQFMQARNEAEQIRKKTEENTKELELTVKQSQLLRDTFREIGNGSSIGKLKEDASSLLDQIKKNNQEIEEQNKKLQTYADERRGIFKVGGHELYTSWGLFASALQYATGKADALKDSNVQLNESQRQLEETYAAQQQEQLRLYAGTWDGVTQAVQNFDFSASGALGSLNKVADAVQNAMKNMGDVDAARASWETYSKTIVGLAADTSKKLRQKEMTNAQRMQDDLKEALANARKGNVVDPEDSEAVKSARKAIADQKAIDALAEAKKKDAEATRLQKAAEQEHATQLQSLTDRIDQRMAADQESLDLGKKLLPEEKLRAQILQEMDSAKSRLTASEKAGIQVKLDELVVVGKQVKAQEELRKATEDLARLKDQLDAEMNSIAATNNTDLLGMTAGGDVIERMKRMNDITDDYAKKMRDLRKSGLDTNSDNYKNQLAEYRNFTNWRIAEEQRFQQEKRRLQDDWISGMRAGFEDWAAQVNNLNENMRQVATDSLNRTVDTINQAVTTGKASFKDLMTYVLQQITRVLMAKAVAKLAELVIGLFGGGTNYGSSGGVGYIGGNGTGGYGMMTQSANGNVMTSAGPAKLNYYEKGGIARSPQLSIFGEGRLPEAYVPLPDGRSIPVTMSGGVGGIGGVSVEVNVDNSGKGDVSTEGSESDQARKLGSLIGMKVRQTMAEEMRQGGILWKMKNGN